MTATTVTTTINVERDGEEYEVRVDFEVTKHDAVLSLSRIDPPETTIEYISDDFDGYDLSEAEIDQAWEQVNEVA